MSEEIPPSFEPGNWSPVAASAPGTGIPAAGRAPDTHARTRTRTPPSGPTGSAPSWGAAPRLGPPLARTYGIGTARAAGR